MTVGPFIARGLEDFQFYFGKNLKEGSQIKNFISSYFYLSIDKITNMEMFKLSIYTYLKFNNYKSD